MTKLNKIKKALEENNIKYYDIGETQSPAGHKYIDILYVSFDKENIDECIMQYSFKIPKGEINNMQDFKDKIAYSEKKFIKYWKMVLNQNNESVKS